MSLLTGSIVKNRHILAGILKKRQRPILKDFQYEIWTSVKRSGKQLLSETNFIPFLQINCSNLRLKLWQRF